MDSDDGITRAQFSSSRGAHSLRGIHLGSRCTNRGVDQSPGLRGTAGRTDWDSFQANLRDLVTRENFPNLQQLPYELP
jgi:hypothetical protein